MQLYTQDTEKLQILSYNTLLCVFMWSIQSADFHSFLVLL